MNKINYFKYGKNRPITLVIDMYSNGNLFVEMITWEDEDFPEPWNGLTVNFPSVCGKDCAFIDVNNNGEEILQWIEDNNLAVPTGRTTHSGFCVYPEYRFHEAVLREINNAKYEEYLAERERN